MRVFISFEEKDADLAGHVERALRKRSIEAWSALDLRIGEQWNDAIDKASAEADGFVFLIGERASTNPRLLTEWRALLRNDSESKKALIPVIHSHGTFADELPAFLRNRRPVILTTNFDAAIEQVQHFLENPSETRDHQFDEEARVNQANRLEELKQFALALKENSTGAVEHQ